MTLRKSNLLKRLWANLPNIGPGETWNVSKQTCLLLQRQTLASVSQGYLLYQHLWKYNCKMSPLWLFTRCAEIWKTLGNWFQDLFPLFCGLSSFRLMGSGDTVNSHDLPGPIKSKWCYNIKSQEISARTLMFFVLHAGIRIQAVSWIHLEERWSVIQVSKPVWYEYEIR